MWPLFPVRRAAATVLALLALSVLVLPSAADDKPAPRKAVVQVAVSRSLLHGLPEVVAVAALEPFRKLVEEQTSLKTEFTVVEPDQVCDRLATGKLDFVLLPGFEYAWARQKDGQVRPAVLAVNQQPFLYAHLMVREDSRAANFADLKGLSLAMPAANRDHCRLFVENQCRAAQCPCDEFFGKVSRPESVEDALDDLCDGLVQAALVDGVCLEAYKRRKPGRFGKLKEATRSPAFPASALVFRLGGVDEATVAAIRDGLKKASQTPRGRQLLTLGKLTGFDPVPEDFDHFLVEFVKWYPPPTDAGRKTE